MSDLAPEASPPRLAPLLRRAWYGLNQTFRRRIAGSGVTPDQFTVLRWLTENPDGMTQRSLADAMASDPNTITALMARMLKAGLVERRSDPNDARCNRIRLKPKGRQLHLELQPLATTLQSDLLTCIPPAERAQFLAHLTNVANHIEQLAEQEPPGPTLPQ